MDAGLMLQFVINGLLIGGIYATMAISFSVVWGVINVVNIAHGEFLMLGAYTTYWLVKRFNLNIFLTIVISMPILFIIGYSIQRFLIYDVAKKSIFATLLLTYGIALFVENLALWVWKADYRTLTTGYGALAIKLGFLRIPLLRLYVFFFSIGMAVAFYYWLLKTKTGKSIRAARDNKDAARLVGINIPSILAITLGMTAMVAGMTGSAITLILTINPQMGLHYMLRCFLICAFVGVGNIPAAFFGGLALGVLESLASVLISPALKEAIVFSILVIVMVLRPKGLFGGV